MDRDISQLQIRISGKYPIEQKLELGKDYIFAFKAGCVQEQVGDNQDGSVDICYIVKPLGEIKITE